MRTVFLGFGVVSAQSQGFLNLLLRRSLAKTPKILAPNGYGIFSNALAAKNHKNGEKQKFISTTDEHRWTQIKTPQMPV